MDDRRLVCPRCQRQVGKSQSFCTACGSDLTAQAVPTASTCASCGAPMTHTQKFCTKCGLDPTKAFRKAGRPSRDAMIAGGVALGIMLFALWGVVAQGSRNPIGMFGVAFAPLAGTIAAGYALVVGGISVAKRRPNRRQAIAGLVLGAVSMLLLVALGLLGSARR